MVRSDVIQWRQSQTSIVNRHEAMTAHRRAIIIDAAQRVFEVVGLEGASIRSIAQAAGCTTGAIYPYFSGKEEVFTAVLGQSLQGLLRAVEEAVRKTRTPAKAIRDGAVAFYKYYDERPSELALALHLFNGIRPRQLGGNLDKELTSHLEAVLAVFAEQIRRGTERPFAPVVEVEATALFTYLVGLLILRHNGRMRSLNKNAAVLLAYYIKNLLQRLTASRRARSAQKATRHAKIS